MAELADAADSKSAGDHSPCGFDSLLRDHPKFLLYTADLVSIATRAFALYNLAVADRFAHGGAATA